MIQNEQEYRAAVKRLEAQHVRLVEHARSWTEQGFSEEFIIKMLEPLGSWHMKLLEEVQSYEQFAFGAILTRNKL